MSGGLVDVGRFLQAATVARGELGPFQHDGVIHRGGAVHARMLTGLWGVLRILVHAAEGGLQHACECLRVLRFWRKVDDAQHRAPRRRRHDLVLRHLIRAIYRHGGRPRVSPRPAGGGFVGARQRIGRENAAYMAERGGAAAQGRPGPEPKVPFPGRWLPPNGVAVEAIMDDLRPVIGLLNPDESQWHVEEEDDAPAPGADVTAAAAPGAAGDDPMGGLPTSTGTVPAAASPAVNEPRERWNRSVRARTRSAAPRIRTISAAAAVKEEEGWKALKPRLELMEAVSRQGLPGRERPGVRRAVLAAGGPGAGGPFAGDDRRPGRAAGRELLPGCG